MDCRSSLLIVVLGIYPNLLFQVTDPAVTQHRQRHVAGRIVGEPAPSTSTRSRPRSSSPRRSSSSLVADLVWPERVAVHGVAHRVDRRARRADPGDHARRSTAPTASMFGGAYVVDNYALALKAFFLVVAYVTLLMSVDYIGEGDYYQGEFYFLLLTSVLGMMRDGVGARPRSRSSSRSRRSRSRRSCSPAWRKHDRSSNEAGDQVLPHRRAVVGGDALRHVAHLRR